MWLFIEINFTQKLHFLVSFNLVGTELYTSQQTGDVKEVSLSELGNEKEVWFQQDGATAHTAHQSMSVLREMFPSRLVSLRGDIGWPARSPDLAPCDFFLWGYLKDRVFRIRPKTIEDLKAAICEEISNIPKEMTAKVMSAFWDRLRQCVASGGRHLDCVIFKN